jgi:hypothetical protein
MAAFVADRSLTVRFLEPVVRPVPGASIRIRRTHQSIDQLVAEAGEITSLGLAPVLRRGEIVDGQASEHPGQRQRRE